MKTTLKELAKELEKSTKSYQDKKISEHEHISEQYRISTLILNNHKKELTAKQRIGIKSIQQFARGGLAITSRMKKND